MYNQEIETEEPVAVEEAEDVSAPLMDQQTIDTRKKYSEHMIRMSSSWEVACNMPRTEAANVPWALLSEEKIARWIFGVLKHNEAIQYAVRPGVRPKDYRKMKATSRIYMKDHAWTAGPVKVKLGGVHSEAWLQEVAGDLQGQFLTHGLSNMPSWKFMEDSDFIQWMLEHEPTLKYVANFLAKRGAIKEVEPGWWEGDQSQLFQGPRARRAPRLQKAPKKSKKKPRGPF